MKEKVTGEMLLQRRIAALLSLITAKVKLHIIYIYKGCISII